MAEYGGECIALLADLSNLEGVEGLAKQLSEREAKLDILVNNAGAAWGEKLESFSEAGWDKVMDTNVKAVFPHAEAAAAAAQGGVGADAGASSTSAPSTA